jgi:hypothetical protein
MSTILFEKSKLELLDSFITITLKLREPLVPRFEKDRTSKTRRRIGKITTQKMDLLFLKSEKR